MSKLPLPQWAYVPGGEAHMMLAPTRRGWRRSSFLMPPAFRGEVPAPSGAPLPRMLNAHDDISGRPARSWKRRGRPRRKAARAHPAFEERASFSPDSLTGMQANLRFVGPETMESKIFARLTAWQNWIFQRPNAVGEEGALRRYGSGQKPRFDMTRV